MAQNNNTVSDQTRNTIEEISPLHDAQEMGTVLVNSAQQLECSPPTVEVAVVANSTAETKKKRKKDTSISEQYRLLSKKAEGMNRKSSSLTTKEVSRKQQNC